MRDEQQRLLVGLCFSLLPLPPIRKSWLPIIDGPTFGKARKASMNIADIRLFVMPKRKVPSTASMNIVAISLDAMPERKGPSQLA